MSMTSSRPSVIYDLPFGKGKQLWRKLERSFQRGPGKLAGECY